MHKILYAVQGTGNGHITRARVMAPKLREAGFQVTYLFSGRAHEDLFEMGCFGTFLCREGLTFQVDKGRIQYLRTVLETNIPRFIKEVKSLDLRPYDLIISDYEPVTSWAARSHEIPVIGVGHQYAFKHDIPVKGDNLLTRSLMRYFAPVNTGIGLHWHHFDQPILPPIIEADFNAAPVDQTKIVVYLPFERIESIIELLKDFTQCRFHLFHPAAGAPSCQDNIEIHQVGRASFQREFASCSGVITNAGFELVSEALQTGKKLIVKPLKGQFEQLSNALALEKLKLGTTMNSLNKRALEEWMTADHRETVHYPDTAQAIVDKIIAGDIEDIRPDWVKAIWEQVSWSTPAHYIANSIPNPNE